MVSMEHLERKKETLICGERAFDSATKVFIPQVSMSGHQFLHLSLPRILSTS